MAMAETVNIPSLPHGATWRRSSEPTAGRRKSPLKGVGIEEAGKSTFQLNLIDAQVLLRNPISVGNHTPEKIR